MKTVHIISHSHWDREWYLPYEKHHMLLVELMDNVLELFETDPDFKSFYLDGQTIILDDYLEVKPDKEALLKKHIANGKLKIGPFYILQDAFLTSSESNVRNMLIGHQESEKWGAKTEIGYYPDTFGNVGQTPQLMKQLGFDLAAFGRGVKPTGFANKSNEEDNFVSSFSEMKWQGADGTEIFGLLFANWYSNGNEIPSDKESAKRFWDQKLKDAENYASMDHLLFMNGCDHQPVQKDLSEAIRVANALYPDYQFIHSDFPTYMKQMIESLPEDLDTVTGELTSQETEGWYTLTNTASSRVYLKQENMKVSRLLENIAEPLAAMAYDVTRKYPHDILDYAWKVYMQNHPHDSICGCSVDEVHEEMMTRFQKAENVAEYVIDEALMSLTEAIDTEENAPLGSEPFVVFNTTGLMKSQVVSINMELDKITFAQMYPTQSYHKLKDSKRPVNYKVIDSSGNVYPAEMNIKDPTFNYQLPKDAFRQPYMANTVEVVVYVEDLPPFSWRTLYLVPSHEDDGSKEDRGDLHLENEYLKVAIDHQGTLQVLDKVNGTKYSQLLMFEDTGDIGNEYVYKKTNDEAPIYSSNKLVDVYVQNQASFKKELMLIHELQVPIGADKRLDEEQQKVVEFRNRKAQRVEATKPLRIYTTVSLEKNAKHISFKTTVKNEMKDHRLRVLFPTPIQSAHHYADSIYETVKRPNRVSDVWTNPENPQRMHHFVQVCDDSVGMLVEPEGLNEYEVIEEKDGHLTVALTLFRAIGELGDWGYFPTPGAQCLNREFNFTYHLSFHGSEDMNNVRKEALYRHVSLVAKQSHTHTGSLAGMNRYLELDGDHVVVTAVKRNRKSDELITRLYNFTDEKSTFRYQSKEFHPVKSTILEEEESVLNDNIVKPFEIITLKWKKGGKS